VLEDELPSLIRQGYSSFKVYMTYDDLKLSDREMLSVLDVARQNNALVMVHAENADCISWLTDKLVGKAASRRASTRWRAPMPSNARPRIAPSRSRNWWTCRS
jgi:dihydropyrimidinase